MWVFVSNYMIFNDLTIAYIIKLCAVLDYKLEDNIQTFPKR